MKKQSPLPDSHFMIDPQQHVKIWFSRDGLPEKHQSRFIKFLFNNPSARITLIISKKHIDPKALEDLLQFAEDTKINLVDIVGIIPRDSEEEKIKSWIDRELKYYFESTSQDQRGNLSVVSDQLRLMTDVIKRGIQSDCDVEFLDHLPTEKILLPRGFISKTRDDGNGTRVSNDVTGGDAAAEVFKIARCLLVENNAAYHAAVGHFLLKEGKITSLEEDYESHPDYFKLRNSEPKLISAASLAGGPELWARAVSRSGCPTGYEGTNEIRIIRAYPFGFGRDSELTKAQPYANDVLVQYFDYYLPASLGHVHASWDTSWMPNVVAWKDLNEEEVAIMAKWHAKDRKHTQLSVTPPKLVIPKAPSQIQMFLNQYLNPQLLGQRYTPFDELPKGIQEHIQQNGPDAKIREETLELLSPSACNALNELEKKGVLILPEFIKGEELKAVQEEYSRMMAGKTPNKELGISAFNMAADGLDPAFFNSVLPIINNPEIYNILQSYFGRKPRLCAMRGYTQDGQQEMLMRAWDWHQDIKSSGPHEEVKIMVFVGDSSVSINGQAMRVVDGSHVYHMNATCLRATKFKPAEFPPSCADVSVCHGPPGTAVLFDPNVIHSGHRTYEPRSVITLTFAPDTESAPVMVEFPEATHDYSTATATATAHEDVIFEAQTLLPDQKERLLENYKMTPRLQDIKPRFNHESSLPFHAHAALAIAVDVNDDLDLNIRVGTYDTDRDNQLVRFRDVSPDHFQFEKVKDRLASLFSTQPISYKCDISAHRKACEELSSVTDPKKQHGPLLEDFKLDPDYELRCCKRLLSDLGVALGRVDNVQRLRTTLAFIYFTLDRLQCLLEHTRQERPGNLIQISLSAKNVLNDYLNVLYFDDLHQNLANAAFLRQSMFSLEKTGEQSVEGSSVLGLPGQADKRGAVVELPIKPAQQASTREGAPAQQASTREGAPAQQASTREGAPAQQASTREGAPAQQASTREGAPGPSLLGQPAGHEPTDVIDGPT